MCFSLKDVHVFVLWQRTKTRTSFTLKQIVLIYKEVWGGFLRVFQCGEHNCPCTLSWMTVMSPTMKFYLSLLTTVCEQRRPSPHLLLFLWICQTRREIWKLVSVFQCGGWPCHCLLSSLTRRSSTLTFYCTRHYSHSIAQGQTTGSWTYTGYTRWGKGFPVNFLNNFWTTFFHWWFIWKVWSETEIHWDSLTTMSFLSVSGQAFRCHLYYLYIHTSHYISLTMKIFQKKLITFCTRYCA